jgi:hypothetical protein
MGKINLQNALFAAAGDLGIESAKSPSSRDPFRRILRDISQVTLPILQRVTFCELTEQRNVGPSCLAACVPPRWFGGMLQRFSNKSPVPYETFFSQEASERDLGLLEKRVPPVEEEEEECDQGEKAVYF